MAWRRKLLREVLSSSSPSSSSSSSSAPIHLRELVSLSSSRRQQHGFKRFHSTKVARLFDDGGFDPALVDRGVAPADAPLGQPNAELLFSRMSSRELAITLLNLELMACGPLVDAGMKILKSPVANLRPFRDPILWGVKNSVYSHFCAGEDSSEASKTLEHLWGLGLRGILDYGIEDAWRDSACDENLNHYLATIQQTRSLPGGSVSFSCVKITAVAPLELLQRVTALLRWQLRAPGSIKLPWKSDDSLPLFSSESPRFEPQEPPTPLSPEEESSLRKAEERLHRLCEACEEQGQPLLVDAEDTTVQPAIDYITFAAALKFNHRNQKPLVYSTLQAYLRDSFPRLELAVEEASRRGVPLGVKLVRGAYLSRESALAKKMNLPSPIHSCIEDTHRCYEKCSAFMLEKVSEGQGSIVLATHNFESGKLAANKVEELGMKRGDSRVHFAQLKGMADGLSLSLAQAGFQVSKYLPFGPVGDVLKYLIRRAEENRGLLGSSDQDRRLIRQELTRRFFATQR